MISNGLIERKLLLDLFSNVKLKYSNDFDIISNLKICNF